MPKIGLLKVKVISQIAGAAATKPYQYKNLYKFLLLVMINFCVKIQYLKI